MRSRSAVTWTVLALGTVFFLRGTDHAAPKSNGTALGHLVRAVSLPCAGTDATCFAVLGRAGHHVWIYRATLGNRPTIELTDYVGKRPDLYSPHPGNHQQLLPGDNYPSRPVAAVLRPVGDGLDLVIFQELDLPMKSGDGRWGFSCYAWDQTTARVKPRDCAVQTANEMIETLQNEGLLHPFAAPASRNDADEEAWIAEMRRASLGKANAASLAASTLLPVPEVFEDAGLVDPFRSIDLGRGWRIELSATENYDQADDAQILLSMFRGKGRRVVHERVGFLHNQILAPEDLSIGTCITEDAMRPVSSRSGAETSTLKKTDACFIGCGDIAFGLCRVTLGCSADFCNSFYNQCVACSCLDGTSGAAQCNQATELMQKESC